ncbi:AAA family ATPase [Synechococcus sp. WC10meta]|uniref:AAA family ATPase n=1 Tax=Synechococcus sp. WC10meta TaxID=2964537 RepID=UPI0039C27518
MLKRVRIQGYRCFRDVEVELKPLQILVGPNGSGKSAFLDAIRFVEDIVRNGLKKAVERRARHPSELSWYGKSSHINQSRIHNRRCRRT